MKQFRRKQVEHKTEFLENAYEAQAYVYQTLKENQDGIYSDAVEGVNNLYSGNAGILHMYIQFQLVEPSAQQGRIIKGMTRYLNLHLFDDIRRSAQEGERVAGMSEAFYSGIGGIGLVFNEVYRIHRDPLAKEGAGKVIQYYKNHVKKNEYGSFWLDSSSIFFDGGIILFLIDCWQTYEEERQELQELITDSCDYILNHGIWHDDGGLEIDHMHIDFKHKEPNFEFGTAGAGYLFAKVYELTGNLKYLDAAKAATFYLKSIAVKQQKGYLIPYKLGQYDDLFYLGNCHGPVGTAKLFYELYKITKEKKYLDEVFQLCEGAMSLGAPFVQSAGFWNTTCVCCGPAGYVPLYAGLYYETGEERWKNLAHGVGEVLIGTKKEKEIEKKKIGYWKIAFDRTKPDVLTTPVGYYTGTAGIAVSLLQVYCMETEKGHTEGLIDDPYRKSTF